MALSKFQQKFKEERAKAKKAGNASGGTFKFTNKAGKTESFSTRTADDDKKDKAAKSKKLDAPNKGAPAAAKKKVANPEQASNKSGAKSPAKSKSTKEEPGYKKIAKALKGKEEPGYKKFNSQKSNRASSEAAAKKRKAAVAARNKKKTKSDGSTPGWRSLLNMPKRNKK